MKHACVKLHHLATMRLFYTTKLYYERFITNALLSGVGWKGHERATFQKLSTLHEYEKQVIV